MHILELFVALVFLVVFVPVMGLSVAKEFGLLYLVLYVIILLLTGFSMFIYWIWKHH